MTHLALFYLPTLWHPLSGQGYQFWSGIAGSFLMTSGIAVFLTKHNCHEHRCLRLSWHPDADGHPVCKKHHGDHPSRGWWRSDRAHTRHHATRR